MFKVEENATQIFGFPLSRLDHAFEFLAISRAKFGADDLLSPWSGSALARGFSCPDKH